MAARDQVVQKIAILGAESTGKTSLAQALAARLGGLWVPEYLREFCERAQRTPTIAEQSDIMQVQIALEQRAIDQAEKLGVAWVMSDTTPFMTAVYSEYIFGDTSLYDRAVQYQRTYAKTLLTSNDIGWHADGLQRESAAVQSLIDRLLRERLRHYDIAVCEVTGFGEARLASALSFLNAP